MKQRNTAVDLTDLAIGILILGIVVSIGARILIQFRDNQLTNLDTVTTSNESTYINNSADTLANTWGITVDLCYSNATGSGTLAANSSLVAGNYTVAISPVDGTITLTNATAAVFPDAACTYTTYDTTSRSDYELANDAAVGIGEYGNWFDIIVIVGVAALILALIFMAFGNRGQDSGISY